MGKPRLIILIRHAQSEGNVAREIHQVVPDHRVPLTDEGHKQAEGAGRRLRQLLKPDDTLQIFTSPYRRTRETTEGILKTLTARNDPDDPHAAPSPFSRSKIKVYEEPRIREQDFGNFQGSSTEMERIWKERANYGHFFYRIPNGESAADAYDRISGFNESLWRQFGDSDFPSVCVLVTHGLMSRVFLMKWYHWSVEYFEDLRNVNHCEFILMRQKLDSGKFVLESQLRTWSELKRQRAEEARKNPTRRNTLSAFLTQSQESPNIPPKRKGTSQDLKLPPAAEASRPTSKESDDHAFASSEPRASVAGDGTANTSTSNSALSGKTPEFNLPSYLKSGHSTSGADTPHEMPSDDEGGEYFAEPPLSSMAHVMRKVPQRKATPEDIERWVNESGMGKGKQADALGDEPAPGDAEGGEG